MELRHLRYFIAVAKQLSFSRAAEELHTAQPSLSQQIRALERELKVTLFERTARSVRLTPAGELLLPEARAIVERVDSLGILGASSSGPRGPLRIVSFPVATIGVLPRVLPSYRAAFREVEVSVETWAMESGLRPLLERRIDMAFARGPIDDPRLEAMVIAKEQICVALPNGHRLSSRATLTIGALEGYDLIALNDQNLGNFNKDIGDVFRAEKADYQPTIYTRDGETMLGLVASDMGIAIVSAIVKSIFQAGLTVVPLKPARWVENLCLTWRRDRADVPVIRSFREHVANAALKFSASSN
jgi:DNA-binding transcriptional LysR family regulator